MPFLASIGAKAWGILAAVGGFMLLLFTAYSKGKSAAKNKMNAKTVDTVLKTNKKVRDNEKDVRDNAMSASDRLRKNYSRD